MAIIRRLSRFWRIPALLLALLLCALLAAQVVSRIDYATEYSDFVPFWLAGSLLAHGGDPYDALQWQEGYSRAGVGPIIDPAFLYPLPLALFFIPLGLLPLRSAQALWVTVSLLAMLLCLWALLSPARRRRAGLLLLPLLLGLLFFRPAALTVVTGHVSALFLLLLTAALLLFEKGRPLWAGALLAGLLLKPNLGAPVLVLLAPWLLGKERRPALAGMAAAGVALLALGLVVDPSWPAAYWQVGEGKLSLAFGFSPTLWGLAALACGFRLPCTLPFGGLAALLILLPCLWLLARPRAPAPAGAFALAITAGLLVTPYTWTYDQLLLLLPISALALSLAEEPHLFLPAALLFPLLDLAALALLVPNTLLQVEILNVFIPLVVLALLLWRLPGRKAGPHPQPGPTPG